MNTVRAYEPTIEKRVKAPGAPRVAVDGGARKRGPGQPRKGETPLAEWLDRKGISRGELAERLKTNLTRVNRYCNGDARPSFEHLEIIEEMTGGEITFRSWISRPQPRP